MRHSLVPNIFIMLLIHMYDTLPCEGDNCCREDANEEVKLQLLAALGAWLSHAQSIPGAALQRLKDGMKEKDALRRAHLRSLNQV